MTAAPAQFVPPAGVNPRPVPVPGFDREFDLLLACCDELTGERDRVERIREMLSRPLDWSALLASAEHHGVLSQLYRALSQAGASRPEFIAIRQRCEASTRQALWLSRELLRILDHFESLGIETLPHKGPVLAEFLYGSVAERQFSDLDLIVRPTDVPRAKAALTQLGYTPGIELTPREEHAYLASGYEYTFDSARGRNLVEIQWQVLPRFYSIGFDVAAFFERSVKTNVSGRAVRTLSTEDTFLVLCVHAAKHAWVQLSWLCDIAVLARSRPVDWKLVQSEASRLGIERIVSVNLFLINELLGMLRPPWVRCDAETEGLAKTILPIITTGGEYHAESIPYFHLMMRLRERRKDRAKFLWRLASTPSVGEWSAVRLPDVLFPFYRAVRFFRLAGKLRRP